MHPDTGDETLLTCFWGNRSTRKRGIADALLTLSQKRKMELSFYISTKCSFVLLLSFFTQCVQKALSFRNTDNILSLLSKWYPQYIKWFMREFPGGFSTFFSFALYAKPFCGSLQPFLMLHLHLKCIALGDKIEKSKREGDFTLLTIVTSETS